MSKNPNEVICPHCETAFTIDEAGFADILKQVRDREFESELHDRLVEAEKLKEAELKLAEVEAAKKFEAEKAKQAEEIARLKAEAKAAETEKELEITKALADEKARADKLKNELALAAAQRELDLQKQKSEFDVLLKNEKDEVARLKDFKAKQSVKIIGETLEQHCETEFNRIRATAFPLAYFEKDNDAKDGTKGDYIFRDLTADGIEKVSIMFDMKNEDDTSKTKQKNDDFLKKLHEDRVAKGCEYAVLVTVLEPENEYYNSGIVDVSHKYPKMYVIRPQFFLTLMMLLSNESGKALAYKEELAIVKAQNVDVSTFEADLQKFQEGFKVNYDRASKNFNEAIKRIDDSIADLEKVKEALLTTDRNLRIANDKAQDISVKKLTRKNLTMKQKFEDLG